eukprot:2128606-Amphidinium_carterae.1
MLRFVKRLQRGIYVVLTFLIYDDVLILEELPFKSPNKRISLWPAWQTKKNKHNQGGSEDSASWATKQFIGSVWRSMPTPRCLVTSVCAPKRSQHLRRCGIEAICGQHHTVICNLPACTVRRIGDAGPAPQVPKRSIELPM